MKPRLLDLFCGAGGAAMGYHRAGFEVIGVDIKPMPRFPFEFYQEDAMQVLEAGGLPIGDGKVLWLDEFDAIHASPPCQHYSVATLFHRGRQEEHPDLVDAVRECLARTGVPYVIENVPQAPLENALMLCGTMFPGLKVYRHRLFECEPPIYFPPSYHNPHMFRPTEVGRRVAEHGWMTVAGHFSSINAAREAMGIDWMSRDELAESIPPAYTEYIGKQLMAVLA